MWPFLRVEVEGEDITTKINDRLICATVQEYVTHHGDTFSLTLDDRNPPIDFPPKGAVIAVSMGYLQRGDNAVPYDGVKPMGVFILDERTCGKGDGGRTLSFTGHAVATFNRFKNQRTGIWENATIEDIVRDCAQRAGLDYKVHPDVANKLIMCINQSQSDQDFLNRLAGCYSCAMKTLQGVLYFAPLDKIGMFMPSDKVPDTVKLDETDMLSWEYHSQGRAEYAGVYAPIYDKDLGKRKMLRSYQTPAMDATYMTVPEFFATAPEAQNAANSVKRKHDFAKENLHVTTLGNPKLMAGSLLTLTGIRKQVPTDWRIIDSNHTIDDSGYHTTLKAEVKDIPKPE